MYLNQRMKDTLNTIERVIGREKYLKESRKDRFIYDLEVFGIKVNPNNTFITRDILSEMLSVLVERLEEK